MAGAVSAGAYTAGVIDYLLETLQAWQDEKDRNLAILYAHQNQEKAERLLDDGYTSRALSDEEIELLKAAVYDLDEHQLNALKDYESNLENVNDIDILEMYGYKFEIPMHDVVLEVLGGASAGAMTAALATVALFGHNKPVKDRVKTEGNTGNVIYDAWVNLIDDPKSKKSKTTLEKMFGKEDLKGRAIPT